MLALNNTGVPAFMVRNGQIYFDNFLKINKFFVNIPPPAIATRYKPLLAYGAVLLFGAFR